jgi:hypothetical protein
VNAKPAIAPSAVPFSGLSCDPEGLGFNFSLPLVTDYEHISQFWYRINAGPWQQTNWFWGDMLGGWVFDQRLGRWVQLGQFGAPIVRLAGRVEAWERYYYYSSPTKHQGWINLGSCRAVMY